MKISLASDHGGFELKESLKGILENENIIVFDKGCFSKDSVDYPDFAKLVCQDVVNKNSDFGILICTSAIGMSIAANKQKGARAALCLNEDMAHFGRLHNDANILCLGQKYLSLDDASKIVKEFLSTSFEGGRHQKRVDKFE